MHYRNLSLRLVTKARACKVAGQEEGLGVASHAPGSAKSVRNEPSHSQVNSHCGSWSPKWTPKFSKRDCKGQNPLVHKVFYANGTLLECRCLKWAHMTHLDI